jgi:hypothetical protein
MRHAFTCSSFSASSGPNRRASSRRLRGRLAEGGWAATRSAHLQRVVTPQAHILTTHAVFKHPSKGTTPPALCKTT